MTLRISNIQAGYAESPDIIDGVSLNINDRQLTALLGPNGTGKSTLLKSIAGLISPDEGAIQANGQSLLSVSRQRRAERVGYLPQSEDATFAPTVFEAVLIGRTPHTPRHPSTDDRERVSSVLEALDIADLAMRPVDELSGGQRQKVRIARLLVQEPDVMLLDEPTAGLDLHHRIEVMKIIQEHITEQEVSALVTAHDIGLISRFADKVALLHNGRIYATGPPKQVLTAESIEDVYGVSATIIEKGESVYIKPEPVLKGDDKLPDVR